jgi:hypothetical protein
MLRKLNLNGGALICIRMIKMIMIISASSSIHKCEMVDDQSAQFTAQAFTSELEVAGVLVSMDGLDRVYDNIFVERLWRRQSSIKIFISKIGVSDPCKNLQQESRECGDPIKNPP